MVQCLSGLSLAVFLQYVSCSNVNKGIKPVKTLHENSYHEFSLLHLHWCLLLIKGSSIKWAESAWGPPDFLKLHNKVLELFCEYPRVDCPMHVVSLKWSLYQFVMFAE